jgi:hypothetical protein
MRRPDRAPDDLRRALAREGCYPACEVCLWTIPEELGGGSAIDAHHVVPIAAGGADAPENLALLCPNHHAIAHRLWPLYGKRGAEVKGYDGPRTPADLVEELHVYDADPEHYRLNRLRRFVDARESALADMRRVLPEFQPP